MIEEIKSKLNIVELVGELGYQPNKQNFIYSIYKSEKHPSLKLYPKTNSFFDFSTGKGGDVIDFYKDHFNVNLKIAVRELAEKLNIKSSNYSNHSEQVITNNKPIGLELLNSEKNVYRQFAEYFKEIKNFEIKETEQRAFDAIIKKREEIQKIIYEELADYCNGPDDESMKYLTGPERGLNEETIKKFKLFSIKNIQETINCLRKTFSQDQLILSGLFNKGNKFVFFHHRLIIPYLENGEIIYLRGRYLNSISGYSNGFGKYIALSNFATNLGSKRLFNKDILKEMDKDFDLVICEGEFDAMRMCQNGYNAISIPGVTNFPNHEINTLMKYDIILAFDNDDAGKNATIELSKLFNKRVYGLYLKKHKDITEFLNDRTKNRLSA